MGEHIQPGKKVCAELILFESGTLIKKMSAVRVAQAISGLLFGSFLILHFATHFSVLLGPESFNNSLKLYRNYYQHPIIEFGLLPASVLIHVICGFITSRQRGGFTSL